MRISGLSLSRAYPGWEWSWGSWVQQYLLMLGTDGPLVIQSHMGRQAHMPPHPTDGNPWDATQDEGLSQDILRSQAWGEHRLLYSDQGPGRKILTLNC